MASRTVRRLRRSSISLARTEVTFATGMIAIASTARIPAATTSSMSVKPRWPAGRESPVFGRGRIRLAFSELGPEARLKSGR